MTAIDPSKLTVQQRVRLAELNRLRFIRVRNGFRVPGQPNTLSLKLAAKLSGLGLVREMNERGQKTLVLTGAGKMTLGVLEERKALRSTEARP